MKKIYIPPYTRGHRKWNRKGHYRKARKLGKRTMKVTRRKFIQLVRRDKSGQILGTELRPIRD